MKLAKSILYGVTALGIAAGSALANETSFSSMPSDSVLLYEETYVLLEPSFDGQVAWNDSPSFSDVTYIYEIDDDMDGRADRLLILEESDSLAMSGSDAGLETPIDG